MGEKRRAARVPQPVPPGIFLRICARVGLPQRVQCVKSSQVPPELAQVARTEATNKSTVQSTQWQLASWLKFGAYSGFYADAIALALAKASAKNPQTPLSGVLPLQASNGVQNSATTTTATNVVTIAGTAYPTAGRARAEEGRLVI
jgi:hypothetical protein